MSNHFGEWGNKHTYMVNAEYMHIYRISHTESIILVLDLREPKSWPLF